MIQNLSVLQCNPQRPKIFEIVEKLGELQGEKVSSGIVRVFDGLAA